MAKLTPCIVLIPLAYNDGTPVSPVVRDELLERLFVEFGGWTIEGSVRGAYRRQDTRAQQVEILMKVKVCVPGERGVRQLRALVAEIGAKLGQESMYLEVGRGSKVELVPPKKGDR